MSKAFKQKNVNMFGTSVIMRGLELTYCKATTLIKSPEYEAAGKTKLDIYEHRHNVIRQRDTRPATLQLI